MMSRGRIGGTRSQRYGSKRPFYAPNPLRGGATKGCTLFFLFTSRARRSYEGLVVRCVSNRRGL